MVKTTTAKTKIIIKKQWLRRGVRNPGVPFSNPLGGSKNDSAFHPSNVDKLSTRNFWELSGKKKTASSK